jgi:sporulation protein YlmC with PRC-barrel domain
MSKRVSVFAVAYLLLGFAVASAQSDNVDVEAQEMVAELIGAPVLATDGVDVGEVADIKFDEKLQPHSLRIKTATVLGLGVRTLHVPQDAFIAVRGAIALRVPSEAVPSFVEITESR